MNSKSSNSKDNLNKQINEIKTTQDMKEEINNDIEILKNDQIEINTLVFQIKPQLKV
jgi:gas vesicle protein